MARTTPKATRNATASARDHYSQPPSTIGEFLAQQNEQDLLRFIT